MINFPSYVTQSHATAMHCSPRRHPARGFTLMEMLVAAAILIVLAAITYPIVMGMRGRAHKTQALKVMANLGAALGTYAADHDGMLPDEDAPGKDDWSTAALPAADTVWYNALPRAVQSMGVGDFVSSRNEAAFYTRECMLFLPGAYYPQGRKMARPHFGMAFNSRLQRSGKDGSKPLVKLNQVVHTSRTVAFFERGLPGEKRAHNTISKKDYDGSPKGTAKAFVARYQDRGVITFLDGSAKAVSANELLQENGDLIWSADQATSNPSMFLWAPDPQVDPNMRLE